VFDAFQNALASVQPSDKSKAEIERAKQAIKWHWIEGEAIG